MLTASDLLKDSSRYSRTLSFRIDVVRGGTVLANNLKVINGTMAADRTSQTRLACSLDLAFWPWETMNFDNRTCRVRLYRGMETPGYKEVLKIGEFRIEDIIRSPGGLVTLNCAGLEAYIIDARFVTPRTPPRGASTVGTISNLIKEVLPSVRVRNEATTNRRVLATAPWARERWDAIESLGDSLMAETYADARGEFVIKNVPSLSTGTPVLRINEGFEGLLVDERETDTRDQVYNAASVSGTSSDPKVPPVWAWSYVSDPHDELYYYGNFGQVPIFYTSQFFTTTAQCLAYSQELLVRAKARNASLTFATPPTLWWLEVGDLVQVTRLDGTEEVHLLQKMSGGLGVENSLQFDTMSTKVAARL